MNSPLTVVITPPPDSTDGLTEWHRTGERQFIISVNDSWSIWALAECDIPDTGKLSYSFNITPLVAAPNCEPLFQLSTCNEYYNTTAMPNRIGVTEQNRIYDNFEFGLQYISSFTMCHQHLKFFMCQYGYPRCTEIINENRTQTLIDMPCRQFCVEIYDACEYEFVSIGSYMAILTSKCELLPDQNEHPDCVFPTVDCKEPPQATSGDWSFTSTTLDSTADLECDNKFFLRGTGKIRCDYSGQWTQSDAECIPVYDNRWLYLGIAVASMVVVLLVVALPLVYKWRYEINVLLYNKFRFRFRKQREKEGKQYDAFIVYNVKVLHIQPKLTSKISFLNGRAIFYMSVPLFFPSCIGQNIRRT